MIPDLSFQDTVSVHRPSFYADRFLKFMNSRVFKKIQGKIFMTFFFLTVSIFWLTSLCASLQDFYWKSLDYLSPQSINHLVIMVKYPSQVFINGAIIIRVQFCAGKNYKLPKCPTL